MSNGYLTLSRKVGDELFFFIENPDGSRTEFNLVISELDGYRAKLSIQAPENITIMRGELLLDTSN